MGRRSNKRAASAHRRLARRYLRSRVTSANLPRSARSSRSHRRSTRPGVYVAVYARHIRGMIIPSSLANDQHRTRVRRTPAACKLVRLPAGLRRDAARRDAAGDT